MSSSRHSSWQWVHEVSQRHRACVFLPPTPIWHLAFPKCCCEPERGCLSLLQVSVFFYLHPARQHCPHASVVTYFPRNIKAWLRPYLCALKSKLGLSRLPQGCQSQPPAPLKPPCWGRQVQGWGPTGEQDSVVSHCNPCLRAWRPSVRRWFCVFSKWPFHFKKDAWEQDQR